MLFILTIFHPAASATDVSLNLTLTSVAEQVTATVANRSPQAVPIAGLQVELNRRTYILVSADVLPPFTERAYRLSVAMPDLPGSYLIASRLLYRNGDHWLTLQNVGIFYAGQRDDLSAVCRFEDTTIRKNRQRLTLHADAGLEWRLFLPEELMPERQTDNTVALSRSLSGVEADGWLRLRSASDKQLRSASGKQHKHFYSLGASIPGLINRYTVYAGAERIAGGRHKAALCSAPLTVDGQFGEYARGRLADGILYLAAGGAAFGVWLLTMFGREKLYPYAAYLARLFFIGLTYIVLRHAPLCLDALNLRQWPWLNIFSDHFWGDAYRFFFEYFADGYFLAYALLGLPYFLLFAKPYPQNDKYQALLRSLFSVPRLLMLQRPHWSSLSRLGLLTLLVKMFFLPYMISWSIQNVRHIAYLTDAGLNGFTQVNDLLQTVFMLLDTGIFAFGYLVESRRLGSEIKSVDATFSGWLVCLWCYPPFNGFSFRYFDYPLADIHIQTPVLFQTCMTAAVTSLWGVFCLASINLGFKASNMTNRGIVTHGLYRYVRHPAYACKILAWVIQGVFLGQYTLGILLAFTVIYVLRALTEERHLGLDPEYLAYKRQVPWRFVPGVL